MDTPRRTCALMVLCAALVGACESSHQAPPGFVEACWGGRDFDALKAANPQFQLHLPASPDQWPAIARRFQEFGTAHNLEYFDTSVSGDHIKSIIVHLCSPKGLWLTAEKKLMTTGQADPDPNTVPIYLFQYEPQMNWAPIASELERSLQDWPGGVQN